LVKFQRKGILKNNCNSILPLRPSVKIKISTPSRFGCTSFYSLEKHNKSLNNDLYYEHEAGKELSSLRIRPLLVDSSPQGPLIQEVEYLPFKEKEVI
jgi:hypothetical protein